MKAALDPQKVREVMRDSGQRVGGASGPRLCETEVVCELAAPLMRTHGGRAGCIERKVEDREGT